MLFYQSTNNVNEHTLNYFYKLNIYVEQTFGHRLWNKVFYQRSFNVVLSVSLKQCQRNYVVGLTIVFNQISYLKQFWWKLTIIIVSTLIQSWYVYKEKMNPISMTQRRNNSCRINWIKKIVKTSWRGSSDALNQCLCATLSWRCILCRHDLHFKLHHNVLQTNLETSWRRQES